VSAEDDARLSPAFDLVCTTVYLPNDVPALGLGGTKAWPDRRALERFAREHCGLARPAAVLDEVTARAMAFRPEERTPMWKSIRATLEAADRHRERPRSVVVVVVVVDDDVCGGRSARVLRRAEGEALGVEDPHPSVDRGRERRSDPVEPAAGQRDTGQALADRLRARGTPVFGPGADGAQLEGSKAWMKDVLVTAGVATAWRCGTLPCTN